MIVAIIACTASNNVIGYENTIPWYIPQDLTYFKNKTLYSPCIMGKNTFLSLKQPLKNRLNIVISSTLKDQKDVLIFKTLTEALLYLKELNKYPIVYIIGGEQLYKEGIKYADKIFLTKINKRFEGDTYFPKIPYKFAITDKDILYTQKYRLTFYTYKNKNLSFFKYVINRIKYFLLN